MNPSARWMRNAGFAGYYESDGFVWSPYEAYPADAIWIPFEDTTVTVTIPGVGPDAPTVVAANGARQSATLYRFDLVDAPAMFEMAAVLAHGAEKYGVDNWRGLTVDDHLNHLLQHVFAYMAGDRTDGHLSHAMCRAMFALATDITARNNPEVKA